MNFFLKRNNSYNVDSLKTSNLTPGCSGWYVFPPSNANDISVTENPDKTFD